MAKIKQFESFPKERPLTPLLDKVSDPSILREFNEFELVGNGLACWQVLDDEQSAMVRKKLAALK